MFRDDHLFFFVAWFGASIAILCGYYRRTEVAPTLNMYAFLITTYGAASYFHLRCEKYELAKKNYQHVKHKLKREHRFYRDRELMALVWMIYGFLIGSGALFVYYVTNKMETIAGHISCIMTFSLSAGACGSSFVWLSNSEFRKELNMKWGCFAIAVIAVATSGMYLSVSALQEYHLPSYVWYITIGFSVMVLVCIVGILLDPFAYLYK